MLPFAGDNLGRLAEFPARIVRFWNALTVGLALKAEVIRTGVLPVLSAKFAMQSVVSILALIIVVKTLTVMTSLHAVVLFLPRLYAEVVLPKGFRPFVGWVVLINLLMLIIFLLPTFFLQARFTMPMVLAVLLLLPFLLNRAWSLWQEKSDSWFYSRLFPVVIVITLLMGADGLISMGGYSKVYLRDTAEWIEQKSETDSKIVTSESDRFCYYIGRNSAFEERLQCHYRVKPRANMVFDYLVLYQKKGVMPDDWVDYLSQADLHEVAKFENSRHDGMIIYQQNR